MEWVKKIKEFQVVDYKLVRSMVLAFVICFITGYTGYLVISMIKDYLNVIMLALVSSLAMRPLKESLTSFFKFHFRSEMRFSFTRHCLFGKIVGNLIGIREFNPIRRMKERAGDLFNLVVITYVCYIALLKIKIGSLIIGGFVLAAADLIFRFKCDIVLMIILKLKPKRKTGALNSFISILVILLVLIVAILAQSLAAGAVFIEITEQGQIYIKELEKLMNSEMVDDYYNQVKDLIQEQDLTQTLSTLFEDANQDDDQTCSSYIEYLSSVPYIGNLAFGYAASIDYWMDYIGFSTGQLFALYNFYSERVNSTALNVSVLMGTTLMNNLSAITYSVSSSINSFLFYMTMIFLLVSMKDSVIDKLIKAIPIDATTRKLIEETTIRSVLGLFKSIFKVSISHFLLTWMLYDLANLPFKYTMSSICALAGLFPLVSTWILHIPTIISLCVQRNFIQALVVLVYEWFVMDYIDSDIYVANMEHIDPSLITLAIAMGIYNYGVLGIIYGPLIAALAGLLYSLYSTQTVQLTT